MVFKRLFVVVVIAFLGTICQGQNDKEYAVEKSYDLDEKFHISIDKVDYYEALQLCHEQNMQLVSIESRHKDNEIFALLNGTNEHFWTSGNKISKGTWFWLKGEPIEYFNWDTYRHNDRNSYSFDCIEVYSGEWRLIWKDQRCTEKKHYICEKLPKEILNPRCEFMDDELVQGNTLEDKKYFIGREIITYSKALQMCRSMCMRLVSIPDKTKNHDLFEAFVAGNATEIFWSSGHLKPRNQWEWTKGGVAKFTSWNPHGHEPNNARQNEFCIEILKNDETIVWNDQPCEDRRMYICETVANKA